MANLRNGWQAQAYSVAASLFDHSAYVLMLMFVAKKANSKASI